ncbi:MAG: response regulator transcription factor [Bdellovibrionales bacterium]|nr:response regulator transcription factor [Bdellovibrionales bacterium]
MSNLNEISNILICDDHFVSAIGVEMLLNQHFPYPLNVKKGTSGKEVLQLLNQESPDLLIIDLGLPDISGLEVIRQIRKSSATLKIIVLTGLNDPHILKQVHQLKVNGILKMMKYF